MLSALKLALRRSIIAGPVTDLHSLVTAPAGSLRIWQDSRTAWHETKFARALSAPSESAPTLLVLSMSNVTYNAKIEAMLAYAARRQGWRVLVLTSRVYTTARRIFRAFGVDTFLNFEDLLAEEAGTSASADAEVERRSIEPLDFQGVLGWKYRDAWIGPQLLASVSRSRFEGAPDPRNPEVRDALLKQLRTSVSFVHVAERQIARFSPSTILVNEPNYHVLGPFVDVAIACAIPVIHYTQPSRDDALVFKKLNRTTRRIHPNSITEETFARLLAKPWGTKQEAEVEAEFQLRYSGMWKVQARNQPHTREMSPDDVRRELGVRDDRPIAAVFSHVLWDANLFYGKDLFANYGEWFVETVRAAATNPRANWVIKLHPANIWKRKLSGVAGEYSELRLIKESLGSLPDHVRLLEPRTPISTLSLFRAIDIGITVRGSIGYELPCFGVPVITAGTGRYSGFGFTIDHATIDSYLATLSKIESIPRPTLDAIRRARVHAHALFRRRPWKFDSFSTEIGDDVTDALNQNLHPNSNVALGRGPCLDLDLFAEWLARKDSIDYLSPESASE
jgi:hypothetical protein